MHQRWTWASACPTRAGMVGRIVVGTPGIDFPVPSYALRDATSDTRLLRAARHAFPSLERTERIVR